MSQPSFFKEIPPYYEHQQETHDFISERVDAGEGRVFDASDPVQQLGHSLKGVARVARNLWYSLLSLFYSLRGATT